MTDEWISFLEDKGAIFKDNFEVEFNQNINQTDSTKLLLTDLSWRGLIEVSGKDMQIFLQGQLINDINAVSSTLSQQSGFCTPKGRLISLFTIFSRKGKLYLQLPLPLLEKTLKRLKMFILMSKVEMNDASLQLARIGVSGKKAVKIFNEAKLPIPGEVNMVTHFDNITLIRLPGNNPRFECIGDVNSMKALWAKLASKARLISTREWKLLDIQSGIPTVYPETSEAFVPQMLNLQLLNGISFKKGCYTGQEVVARMQYLGKLKRRMYFAQGKGDQVPLPGSDIFAPDSSSGQGAGKIVDAQATSDNSYDVLAVIQTDLIEAGNIFTDADMAHKLKVKKLPYDFVD